MHTRMYVQRQYGQTYTCAFVQLGSNIQEQSDHARVVFRMVVVWWCGSGVVVVVVVDGVWGDRIGGVCCGGGGSVAVVVVVCGVMVLGGVCCGGDGGVAVVWMVWCGVVVVVWACAGVCGVMALAMCVGRWHWVVRAVCVCCVRVHPPSLEALFLSSVTQSRLTASWKNFTALSSLLSKCCGCEACVRAIRFNTRVYKHTHAHTLIRSIG